MARSARVAAVVTCALAAATSLVGDAYGQATKPAAAPLPALGNASVSVPWTELSDLLDRAREAPAKPPVDYVFAAAAYAGTVTGDSARVTADLDVTLLRDGFVLVPLGPADGGVESATVDGQPAALVPQNGQLNALLTGPGRKKLALVIRRPVASDGGTSRVQLAFPPASAINTLALTVPGASAEPQSPDATGLGAEAAANGATKLTATFRGGAAGSLAWRPRPPQAAAAEARVYADTQTRASVRRGLVRYQSTLRLSVERGATKQVKVRIDPKAVLLSATGKDVASFDEQAADDVRAVTVTFAQPVQGDRQVDLVYEKDVPEAGGPTPVVPPTVEGARRDAGVVAVESDGAYDVRPAEPAGGGAAVAGAAAPATMERIGVSELPQGLRTPQTQLAYRYAAGGASAGVALAPVKPQPAKLFALTQTRVAIDRGVLRCQAHVTYEILHAGVDTLRVSLPAGAELVGVDGQGVRDTQVVDEDKARTLVVGLKDVAKKEYALTVTYDVHFQEQANAADAADPKNAHGAAVGVPATRPATAGAPNPAPGAAQPAPAKSSSATVSVPLIGHPGAAQARGYVGVEVRGGYELDAAVDGAERIDVKELPQQLWSMARSPLQIGYRYQSGTPAVRLAMTRHRDLDVLVAMADVCEATTTVTPDGRAVTKLMYVTRNNLKPFMTLRLPPGAEVWSTFVDDRPVTPVRTADGRVLVPLKRSDDVEDHDDDSYKAKRERRRKGEDEDHRRMIQKAQDVRAGDGDAADLKPYDVEVVFVTPAAKLADRGQLALALPQSDVPVGQLAWAVFVPKHLKVVDADGNAKEVARFTLPFRHFADVEYAKAEKLAQQKEMAQQQAAQALEKLADAQKQLAEAAKVAGVLPVRVEIPVVGTIYRYEKLLVVDEPATLNLTYARKVE